MSSELTVVLHCFHGDVLTTQALLRCYCVLLLMIMLTFWRHGLSFFLCVSFHLIFVCFCNNNALQCRNNRIKKTEPKLVLKRFIQLVQSKRRNFLLYTTENMLPNDNVSMSVGHLDHVFFVYSSMEHVTWKSPGAMSHSATLGTRWFPGHVFHRAVNNQDVIKMSDGHRNVR